MWAGVSGIAENGVRHLKFAHPEPISSSSLLLLQMPPRLYAAAWLLALAACTTAMPTVNPGSAASASGGAHQARLTSYAEALLPTQETASSPDKLLPCCELLLEETPGLCAGHNAAADFARWARGGVHRCVCLWVQLTASCRPCRTHQPHTSTYGLL